MAKGNINIGAGDIPVFDGATINGHVAMPQALGAGDNPQFAGAILTGSINPPSNPTQGQMWFDSNTGINAMKVWSGGTWENMSYLTGSYGVAWNQSTDTYTTLGIPSTHSALPIQSRMRRCLLADDGTVSSYLHPTDSTLLANGNAATLDGTAGQVMVEIPKFYTKHTFADSIHSWEISEVPMDGFIIHPAFIKNTVEVNFRYIGAYEASSTASKMGSASGLYPAVSKTRTVFRAEASARGTGWRQVDYYLHSAIQLLYLVEYQDFNSQAMIGQGRTTLSGGAWSNNSYIGMCGKSNPHGNQTANQTTAGGGVTGAIQNDFMSYRGIENFCGNVWEMRDGWTVNDVSGSQLIMYATNDDAYFADTGSTNMTVIYDDTAPHASGGYIKELADISTGFLGTEMTAASNTYVGDYYWQYANGSGWSLPMVGASAVHGAQAGAFALAVYIASSSSDVSRSSRLAF